MALTLSAIDIGRIIGGKRAFITEARRRAKKLHRGGAATRRTAGRQQTYRRSTRIFADIKDRLPPRTPTTQKVAKPKSLCDLGVVSVEFISCLPAACARNRKAILPAR